MPTTGLPETSVWRSAQSDSHMLDRNTSEQNLPIASSRGMPVISSAARLKEVMRQSPSTVNTPSEMLSRMASVNDPVESLSVFCFAISFSITPYPHAAGPAILFVRDHSPSSCSCASSFPE